MGDRVELSHIRSKRKGVFKTQREAGNKRQIAETAKGIPTVTRHSLTLR
jgi:hypothetical protein